MNIQTKQLEELLLANWTKFINIRELTNFATIQCNNPVKKITLSRFELLNDGFLVWAECHTNCDNYTVEFTINNREIKHLKTLKS